MEDCKDLLIKSWETFVQNSVLQAGYDKTILATIINIDDLNIGKYLVSDGATKFFAYSNTDKTLYKVDDVVYVNIPNGDFNADKFIISLAPSANDKPINYVSPFDQFFDMTGNILPDEIYGQEYNLIANHEVEKEIKIAEFPVSADDGNSYTRLALKGDFRSLISTAISGNYGIKLQLNFTKNLTSEQEEYSSISKTCYLDTTDMYGNPYNYSFWMSQGIIFDISEFSTDYDLTTLAVYFYQQENFYIENSEKFPYKIGEREISPNLFVKHLYISLGYEANTEEQVIIYTNKDLQYNKEDNIKPIKLRWCHILDNKQSVAIVTPDNINRWITNYDGDGRTVRIHWYDYNKDKNDTLGGTCWEEITPKDENGNYKYQEFSIEYTANVEEATDSIKVIIELIDEEGLNEVIESNEDTKDNYIANIEEIKNSIAACDEKILEYTNKNDATSSFIYLQNIEEQQALKAQYEENLKVAQNKLNKLTLDTSPYYEYLKSNLLLFKNTETIDDKKSNYLRGISLYAEDGGVYRIYDSLTNNIIADSGKHNLILDFNHLFHNKGQLSNPPKKIEWYFPKYNSMLDKPSTVEKTSLNGESISIGENEEYYIVTYVNPILTTGENHSWQKQPFNIKRHLLQTYSNNIVYVKVWVDEYEYELSIELIFGVCGQQGTNNTLIITTGDEIGSGIHYDELDDLPDLDYPNDYVAIRQYESVSIHEKSKTPGCAGVGIVTGNLIANFKLEANDKLLSIFTDIDCCIRANWTNYVQPIVKMAYTDTNGSKKEIIIQSHSNNLQQNGYINKIPTDIDRSQRVNIYALLAEGTDCIYVNNYRIVILRFTGKYKLYTKVSGQWELFKDTNQNKALIEHSPIAWTSIDNNELELEARLYNANDELVPITTDNKVEWSFLYNHNDYIIDSSEIVDGYAKAILKRKYSDGATTRNGCIITCTVSLGQIIANYTEAKGPYQSDLDYYILQDGNYVKVNTEDIDLTTFSKNTYYTIDSNTCTQYRSYLILPNRANREVKSYDGADRVIYQKSNGSTPAYYNGPYLINGANVNSIDLYVYEDSVYKLPDNNKYYPTFRQNKISPKSLYLYNINYDLQISLDKDTLNIPLMILNNQWGSSVLNNWDGEFEVNEENGTILGTMFGAGKKETDNTFSGVLMGNVSKGAQDTSAGLGIFGYQKGIQSFGLNIEGTAFIGKSSTAQLKFDGNEGTFQNAGYKNGTGIKMYMSGLDNDPQYISLKSDNVEYIRLSTRNVDDTVPYLSVNSSNNHSLLYISKSQYYLQSDNYDEGNQKGTKIDLASGYIKGYNFTLALGSGDRKIIIDSTNANTPIQVGNKFTVDWTGKVTANEIYASQSGTIGGFTIGTITLTGNGGDNDIRLYAADQSTNKTYGGGTGNDWRLTIGPDDGNNGMGIDKNGKIFARYIHAFSGKIGPYTLSSSGFKGGNLSLDANTIKIGGRTLKAADGDNSVLFIDGKMVVNGELSSNSVHTHVVNLADYGGYETYAFTFRGGVPYFANNSIKTWIRNTVIKEMTFTDSSGGTVTVS